MNAQKGKYQQLALPYHVPNGGDRHIAVAKKLKKMGARAGIWDVYCPPDVSGKRPLYIEMKAGNNGLTRAQKDFQAANKDTADFEVCYSWSEAANIMCKYYDLDLFVD